MTFDMGGFAARLAAIPGVEAVTLGGSRAEGAAEEGSDWDFGLYYRDGIDTDGVRALGHEGHVAEPGEWGRLMNGGAWLTVGGEKVDLLYRHLSTVGHWATEAAAGRFEIDATPGYLAGMPTYALAAELSTNRPLHGEVPAPPPTDGLAAAAPGTWRSRASFHLVWAEGYAEAGRMTQCAGMLARAALEEAHARVIEQGHWALNEKRLLSEAGLFSAHTMLATLGARPRELLQTTGRMRRLLGLGRPVGMRLDTPMPQSRG